MTIEIVGIKVNMNKRIKFRIEEKNKMFEKEKEEMSGKSKYNLINVIW